jgi:hypothetical protein
MMERRSLLAAAALGALPGIAVAQPAWPSRAVRMVVPFPPGGSNDVLGRALCERLSALVGQPFVVENRGGAGGSIGADQVAKSSPDGYTLLFMSSSLTTNAAVQRLPYNPVTDFTPIAQAAVAPMIVTVGRDSPARTMADLVRIARERPGMLRFGGAICSVGMAVIAYGGPWPLQMCMFAIIGFGFFMLHGSLQAQATDVANDLRSTSVSMHSCAFTLGNALGPAFYAVGINTIGSKPSILIGALTILVIGLFTAARLEAIDADPETYGVGQPSI